MQGKYTASASKEAERLLRLCDRCMLRPPAAVCRPILAERHPPLARYKKRGVFAAGGAEQRGAEREQQRSGAEPSAGAQCRRGAEGGGERWAGCESQSSALSRSARLCPAGSGAAALGGAGRRSQHGAAYQRGEPSAGGVSHRGGRAGACRGPAAVVRASAAGL